MKNYLFLILLCVCMAACSNERATHTADDSKIIHEDTVVMEQAIHDITQDWSYNINNLDFGTIETFVIPNEDEIVRVYVPSADSLYRTGSAAIAVITRNEPFSVDTLRITRDDLNAVINDPDIISLEICSIHFKENRNDTLIFSMALTVPDSDVGYNILCYNYDKKNRFEYEDIVLEEDFLEVLKEDRQFTSDSIRCVRVVESTIYNESSSSMLKYIPLFNYLIEHHNKEYDMGISIDLYKMFTEFPEKQNEFGNYLMLLQKSEQDKVVKSLMMFLLPEYLHEFNISNDTDLEDLKNTFWEKFPFLYKYEESQEEIDSYLKRQLRYKSPVATQSNNL